MKWLKYFEDRNEQTFTSISKEEYHQKLYGGLQESGLDIIYNRWDDINPEDVLSIEKTLGHKGLIRNNLGEFILLAWINPPSEIKNYEQKSSEMVFNIDGNLIEITKFKDEWFYVHMLSNGGSEDWFECDQWDGLMECLKYIKKELWI